MVGVGGLEPPTSRTRTVRATKLRHTPTVGKIIIAISKRDCQRQERASQRLFISFRHLTGMM